MLINVKYKIINGTKYQILDVLNNITLADSFVKNKIGKGHGEAKLYVGSEENRFKDFFGDLTNEFFFLKKMTLKNFYMMLKMNLKILSKSI